MVAIKDMEMPRWCGECPMCREETIEGNTTTYCSILNQDITWNGNRVENCPLVEIVTCKDCKHCEEVHYENEGEPPYVKLKCNSTRNTRFYRVEEDFFCGDGERRE